jgi:hypothetical protein
MNDAPHRWHPFTRTGFRFAFVYLLLFNLPFSVKRTSDTSVRIGRRFTMRFGRGSCRASHESSFHVEVTSEFNGSGDRAFDYVFVANSPSHLGGHRRYLDLGSIGSDLVYPTFI